MEIILITILVVIIVIWLKCKEGKQNDSSTGNSSYVPLTQESQRSVYSARPAYEPYTFLTQESYVVQESIKKLDLHGYSLRDAMEELKTYLSRSKEEYRQSNYSRQHQIVYIITGIGKHSMDHNPVIKPAVENYLIEHNYDYEFPRNNPGMARIDLKNKKDDYRSSNLWNLN